MKNYKKMISVLVVLVMFSVLSLNVYAAQAKGGSSQAKLININTAGVAQLTKLPRIGEKIAQRIVDYRNKNGKFKRAADLMKVKGIGERTFDKLKKMITV